MIFLSDAVTVRDLDNRIVFWNHAAEKRYGWNRKEVLGKLSHDVLQTEFPIPFDEIRKELVKTRVWHGEVTHTSRSGTKLTVATRWSLRSDNSSRPIHIIEFSLDITRFIEETRLANQWKIMGQLASGVAHEVRNPLNTLSALMESLLRELADSASVQPYIEHIKKQTCRLTDIMNDLLELGRVLKREEMEIVPVEKVLHDSVNSFSTRQKFSHRIQLIADAVVRNTRIRCATRKLVQVMINLIENAAHHSPPGSPIKISYDTTPEGMLKIRVIDQGSGFTTDSPERLFEPFFSTRTTGTGLGLFIVRQIVENHGGSVVIENNSPPPGATATVLIPVSG